MKAICALTLLGLTWAFNDDEFLARPVHPTFLRHHNKDIKIDESLFDTPKKFLNFDVTKTPKIFNADDNDNEFFSPQKVEEDGVVLTVKLLQFIKEIKESQSRNIFADDSYHIEDHIFAKKKKEKKSKKTKKSDKSVVTVTDPVKDEAKPKHHGGCSQSFVRDAVKILQGTISY